MLFQERSRLRRGDHVLGPHCHNVGALVIDDCHTSAKCLRGEIMRSHTLKLPGLSEALRNEVGLDFDKLGPGLIAIVGENGAGKRSSARCLRHSTGNCRARSGPCTTSRRTRSRKSTCVSA
jgi:hypothetical protein